MMSDKRTLKPGNLLRAVLGFSRGVLGADFINPNGSVPVGITTWTGTGWSAQGAPVTAYAGLPFTDTIPQGSVVWLIYIYKTYFVILASC